jgi:hypothetical protein
MAIPQELFLVHYVPQELFWFNVLFPMAVPHHTGNDYWKCNEPKKTQINNINSFSFSSYLQCGDYGG